MSQAPKYMLIVVADRGLVIRDTPRPESKGGRQMRAAPVGSMIYAYDLHNVSGVQYARLVPRDPTRPEWVRVAEPDGSIVYVDVVPIGDVDDQVDLAGALRELARAIRELAGAMKVKP